MRTTAGTRPSLGADEVRGGRGLVGDRDPRGPQRAAVGVAAPAPVLERREPGQSDRDVALAVAPRAAEGVGDDDGGTPGQGGAQRPGRGVGVSRQGHDDAVPGRVRGVDARVGAHEPVAGAADEDPVLGPDDLGRLVEHDLDLARVLAAEVRGELARARRRPRRRPGGAARPPPSRRPCAPRRGPRRGRRRRRARRPAARRGRRRAGPRACRAAARARSSVTAGRGGRACRACATRRPSGRRARPAARRGRRGCRRRAPAWGPPPRGRRRRRRRPAARGARGSRGRTTAR